MFGCFSFIFSCFFFIFHFLVEEFFFFSFFCRTTLCRPPLCRTTPRPTSSARPACAGRASSFSPFFRRKFRSGHGLNRGHNSTKKTTRERRKNEICTEEGKKSAKCWAPRPPTLRAHPLCLPHFFNFFIFCAFFNFLFIAFCQTNSCILFFCFFEFGWKQTQTPNWFLVWRGCHLPKTSNLEGRLQPHQTPTPPPPSKPVSAAACGLTRAEAQVALALRDSPPWSRSSFQKPDASVVNDAD